MMTREIMTMIAYMDDGTAFKEEIPTTDELMVKKFVEGNGKLVAVKRATRIIDLDNLSEDDKVILARLIEISSIKA